mmetsp:Transcript_14866/g.13069  ORF Transcript_14866/g.13069 Transcript_14866/m.13069 type:complete len:96 (-) Transcript_14866:760-1047(-)
MFGPNSIRTLLKLKSLVNQNRDDLDLEEEKNEGLEVKTDDIACKTMTNFRKSSLQPLNSTKNSQKYDYENSSDDQEASDKGKTKNYNFRILWQIL